MGAAVVLPTDTAVSVTGLDALSTGTDGWIPTFFEGVAEGFRAAFLAIGRFPEGRAPAGFVGMVDAAEERC
jgi:hypothetical protein